MRNWKSLIDSSAVGKPCLCRPATAAELYAIENEFRLTLPAELRSLLSQTNGIHGATESASHRNCAGDAGLSWVLSAADILQYNREVRDENSAYRYMDPDDQSEEQPVDEFLFFSNIAGNGDLHAICLFPVEGFRPFEVILWDHAENRRTLAAPSLSAWIESWGVAASKREPKNGCAKQPGLALVDA
jgi:hypothetical protein